jgi:hypothetical protein
VLAFAFTTWLNVLLINTIDFYSPQPFPYMIILILFKLVESFFYSFGGAYFLHKIETYLVQAMNQD